MKRLTLFLVAVCIFSIPMDAETKGKLGYNGKYAYTFDNKQKTAGWKCTGIFNAANDEPLDSGSFSTLPYWVENVNLPPSTDKPIDIANRNGSLFMLLHAPLFPSSPAPDLSKWKYSLRSPRLDSGPLSPWRRMIGYEMYFMSNVPGIQVIPTLVVIDTHGREIVVLPLFRPGDTGSCVINEDMVGKWQKISFMLPPVDTGTFRETRYIQVNVIGDIAVTGLYPEGANYIDFVYPLVQDE